MKILTKPSAIDPREFYDVSSLAPLDQLLFVDIETTGFSAKTARIYLIGAACFSSMKDGETPPDSWRIIQWFAEDFSEEQELLEAFFRFASGFTHLVHFNGNQFDLPFIRKRCELLGVQYPFDSFSGTDIYKRVTTFKTLLQLENCKQKSVEDFLGLHREDTYNGGQLIAVYEGFVRAKKAGASREVLEEFTKPILLHNFEDMQGMLEILPILSFGDLMEKPLKALAAEGVSSCGEEVSERESKKDLVIRLSLPSPLPKPVLFVKEGCSFQGEGQEAALRIPIYSGELKYFYPNYKDYFYLPAEDMAIHKSVAVYADSSHREKAKACNCYTRTQGDFLPQWKEFVTPVLKSSYDSPALFFELTAELRSDPEFLSGYASHVLKSFLFRTAH